MLPTVVAIVNSALSFVSVTCRRCAWDNCAGGDRVLAPDARICGYRDNSDRRAAQQYRTGEAQYSLEQPAPRGQLDLVVRQGQGCRGVVCFPSPGSRYHPALRGERR
jgi:hypothetical protein